MDATVKTVQQRLMSLGYNLGPAKDDGIAGQMTWAAISLALNTLPNAPPNSDIGKPITLTTSPEGRKLITMREGNKLQAYQDSGGVWTIGVGHTTAAGDPAVHKGMTISAIESDDILARDLQSVEKSIRQLVAVTLSQNMFDALVSFVFNVGAGAFASSTLLRKINQRDFLGAADEFLKWNKVNGVAVQGLTNRRQSERSQFIS